MSHKVGCLYCGKNDRNVDDRYFFEVSSEISVTGDANVINVFNQLLEYTCHSNTGLSPQVGKSKELHTHITRVGHNLCNPHGLLAGLTSTYEF